MRFKFWVWILPALMTQAAMGMETISSGNASLELLGPRVWDTYLGNGALKTDTAATDQLYQYCWYYRTPNYNQNRYFSYLDWPTESWTGDTATITYTNAGPGLAGQPWSERFDATFTLKIIDGPSPNQTRVCCSLLLHNPNPGTVTYQIFNLVDLDLSGTLMDDTAQIIAPGEVRGKYTETGSGDYAEALGVGATAYEVNKGSILRNKLYSTTPYDLGTTAGPYSGDAAVAFQWTITLAPGASATIRSGFSINQPAVAEIPCVARDADCDGQTDLDDIEPFVNLLLGISSPCVPCTGDVNGDQVVDGRDVQGFVDEFLQP